MQKKQLNIKNNMKLKSGFDKLVRAHLMNMLCKISELV